MFKYDSVDIYQNLDTSTVVQTTNKKIINNYLYYKVERPIHVTIGCILQVVRSRLKQWFVLQL